RDLSRGTWATLGLLVLAAGVLFYARGPLRRLGVRHALVLAGAAGAWWACFRLFVWWGGKSLASPLPSLAAPVYLFTGIGSPMSEPLWALFWYGLVAVAGAFVLAASSAGLRPRWTWAFANAAASLVLCACLTTQLYLRQGGAVFRPALQGRYPYLWGTVYYPLSEGQDPYLLTEPLSFCRFQETVERMDEAETRKWFRGYAEACRKR
ncbi:MAG: hypothetical protein HY744_00295, partial [Deltaproteobacteria bacterium]|nr:hypothetical protein [Deltaproteobacteria bacterium]